LARVTMSREELLTSARTKIAAAQEMVAAMMREGIIAPVPEE
jgi:hypothetical protein